MAKQRITTCLSFNGQAEEAANFYVSIFKNSKISRILRYGDAGPGPKGAVLMVEFQLEGQDFQALNAGPQFTLTPAISLSVACATQAEVDELWDKLSAGGKTMACSWLTDKFGVSWQIVPTLLIELLNDPDPERATRAMEVMRTMVKIDIARLKVAVDSPLF